jgi:uncharacterized protein DUF3617
MRRPENPASQVVTMIVVAVASLAVCARAAADDFPKMRAGLWQTSTMTRDAGSTQAFAPHTSTICIDPSVQSLMVQMAQGMMANMCSKHDLRISGRTVTGDAVCEMMGSRITTKSTMKFSSDTSYHTEAHMAYDPPLSGRKNADSVIDGKYLGPCPAGMAPGDIRLQDGKTINLKAFAGGK